MDLSDKIFIIIFLIGMAINAIFIWMRIALKQKGQEYSYVDRGWSAYYAYLNQMSSDKVMKMKLKRFIIIDSLILIFLTILIVLY